MTGEAQQLSHHFDMPKATGHPEAGIRIALRPSMHVHLAMPSQRQQLSHHFDMPKATG